MRIFLLIAALLLTANANADEARDVMKASLLRHAPAPFVYEEQTLVLSNGHGQYSVRTIKHYVRHDSFGDKDLMVVSTPFDATGMKVYVARDTVNGGRRGAKASSTILGSDFMVSDLEDEQVDEFRYEKLPTQQIEHVKHLVLRALPMDNSRVTISSATDPANLRIPPNPSPRKGIPDLGLSDFPPKLQTKIEHKKTSAWMVQGRRRKPHPRNLRSTGSLKTCSSKSISSTIAGEL